MRTARRRRRIADLEWFEALYRVYLAAFLVGGTILFLSGLVGDAPMSSGAVTDLTQHGPAIIGLIMAGSLYLGMRSGSNGGPVSVENAEVVHVLLAPVARAAALRRPFIQRLRSLTFAGALAGATAGQLAQRRVVNPDSNLVWWAMCGALAGACIGAAFVVAAGLVHALAIPRWLASVSATLLLGWQISGAIPGHNITGPFDSVGGIALWPLRFNTLDIAPILCVALGALLATALVERFSLEALAKRSALVSQLKFAVTLQDIRTVVLLRRQLGGEHSRAHPWFTAPSIVKRDPVIGRATAGILRFPFRRLVRMSILTIASTICAVLAWRGTAPMIAAGGILMFILGLDIVEPLSQEIDQPDRTDALPLERGLLHARLLIAPALAFTPFLLLSLATAITLEPSMTTVALGAMIAPVALLAGLAGATINVVMGAPDQVTSATGGLALPPEVSGMGTVLRAAWPPAVASVGLLPVLAARVAAENDLHVIGNTVRAVLSVCLMLGLVAGWVRQRDAIKAWFKNMQTGSQSHTAHTSTPSTSGGH